MNFINQLLENLSKEKFTHHLETIFGEQIQLICNRSKYNKEIKYFLCVIDIFSKYAWVISLEDKKGTSIVNAFQKIISEKRKPNKIWVDQGGEFYNNSFKEIL